MERLLIDCTGGARKESLVGALLEMLDEEARKSFLARFGLLGLGVDISAGTNQHEREQHGHQREHEREFQRDNRERGDCGDRQHEHDGYDRHECGHDEREHEHEHHSVEEVLSAVASLGLSESVEASVRGVYGLLANAEAAAHGVPVDDVHFHEVGNKFAIAYIAAFCMLIDELSPAHVAATPITTGFGRVDCAHGRLAIPAPATANVLEGLPTRKGDTEGELTTPTGAALVRYFAESYEEAR